MGKGPVTVAVWLSLLAVTGRGADSTLNSPSQQPDRLCTVEGVVTDATTGGPVKKAMVRIYSMERNWAHTTTTDLEGRFVFREVEPGRYGLRAEAPGYLAQSFGEQSFGDGGTEVHLEPGGPAHSLLFRLMPAGVMSGTVRDEDGALVMGALVAAVRPGHFQNTRQLYPGGQVQTDDQGRYRIYPLLPGRYTVVVSYRRPGEDRYVAYPPTFYTGTADPNEARWVDVAPGQEVSEIDINLTSVRAACVRGKVTNFVPSKASTVPSIQLIPAHSPLPDQLLVGNYGETFINDQGEFHICGVLLGEYFAEADYHDGERQYRGRATVDVASPDSSEVSIPLALPFEIHGRVRTDSQLPFDFSKVEVWLRSADIRGGGAGGKMKADGTFVLQDVFQGNYRLQVAGFPEEFYVKSAEWGTADVLADGLVATQTLSSQPLDLLLSLNGGRIDGTVMDHHRPAPGAIVAFVPDAARRERDELYSLTRTDAQGRFSLRGLPPGDFTLYAFEKIDPFLLRDPDFLPQYARYARSVHVQERQQQTVSLELTPLHEN